MSRQLRRSLANSNAQFHELAVVVAGLGLGLGVRLAVAAADPGASVMRSAWPGDQALVRESDDATTDDEK
ncbi:hypothetical protein JCM13580A_62430 [Streptomyces drozdowiczii]